ncbi:hypothetical protein [Isobaculum melis]|uniref:Uncharacterized protein n=1 Tax=Isobaculum melis TaxID=142588 RepID=A0A1H9QLH9_9LACT|nr:hypothetical protein [Isobaculum melis]SER61270.1 hypothetical protein SAMN04488559_102152 [Isobaculum melis]
MIINIYGMCLMLIIMIPNIIYAIRKKHIDGDYHNKGLEIVEQIGRFGSMFFMIFYVRILDFGNWLVDGKYIYMSMVAILALLYCFVWVLYFRKVTFSSAMLLAILPTLIFLISSVFRQNVLFILMSLLFGIGHLTITYQNNKRTNKED